MSSFNIRNAVERALNNCNKNGYVDVCFVWHADDAARDLMTYDADIEHGACSVSQVAEEVRRWRSTHVRAG